MTKEEAIERIKSRYDKWALDDKDLEAIQCTFPELRESEDERIMKFIIDCIEELRMANQDNANFNGMCSDAIFWLKKQNIFWLKKQKEQKPANVDYISGIRDELVGIENNAKSIEGLTDSQWVAIRAAHRLLGEYLNSNQKSAEWSEEDKLNLDNIIWLCENCEKGIETIWIPSQATKIKHLMKSIKEGFAQKPAEWGEEDELMRKRCIADLGCLTECEPEYKERYDAQIKWLKSLSERFNPLPKQEWSEEDKKMLEKCVSHMINIIPAPGKHGLADMSFEKHTDEELVVWLNSLPERFVLQPKQAEWSKEDEEAIKMAIIALEDMYDEDSPNDTYAGYNLPFNEAAKRLKSLGPHPHWMPSEEQMKALARATNRCVGVEDAKKLRKLLKYLEL